VLTRDVTIASAAPPGLGQMDFQFLIRKVLLAPNVTLTMDGLVLHNMKKLGGFNLDFFMVRASACGRCTCWGGGGADAPDAQTVCVCVLAATTVCVTPSCSSPCAVPPPITSHQGDTNSSIVLRDTVRVKYACPPTRQSLQSAQSFAAPPGAPPNSVVLGPGLCIEQPRTRAQPAAQLLQCFDESMQFENFTLQVWGWCEGGTGCVCRVAVRTATLLVGRKRQPSHTVRVLLLLAA
jgi:hypothetical protein